MAYKLWPKTNAPPTFSIEKEGGASKGFLRTIIMEGITITNLENKTSPIFSTKEEGLGN